MRRRRAAAVVALVALALGAAAARAEPTPESSAYLEDALSFIERSSVRRHQVDWRSVRARAYALAENARTTADTYGAIRFVLGELRDNHSILFTPSQSQEVFERQPDPLPTGRRLRGRIGYLKLPQHVELAGRVSYPQAAVAAIRRLDRERVCGWVVDLRGNFGGNQWSMLVAVGPILGEGDVGAFVDADGQRVVWSYRRGQAFLGGGVVATGPAYRPRRPNLPVALVADRATASAGEGVIVAFRGRPQTRTFGQPTAGVPTANSIRRLSDGALLLVTSALDADRTGRTYDGALRPDHAVAPSAAVEAARRWLRNRPSCRSAH